MESPFKLDHTCIFCQIVAGEAEASVVFQDDLVTAFMDLYPVTLGHALVIPNHHATLISDVEAMTIGRMFMVGAQIAQVVRQGGFRCEAVSLYLADGMAAGQAVPHSHLHIVPRFQGDSCGLHLHTGPAKMVTRTMLEEHAETIRRSLKPKT
jgi:histidine triad (HIT) family protein